MIKRLVEKLYYRVFPDRIDEHALAQMPIPVVKEEYYRPEKIMAEVRIPRELMFKDKPPIEWIKEDLAANLVDGVKEHMTIECYDDPVSPYLSYQGYIKFLREGKPKMVPCDNCIEIECEVNGHVCPLYKKYQESKETEIDS